MRGPHTTPPLAPSSQKNAPQTHPVYKATWSGPLQNTQMPHMPPRSLH